jgi:hypothetical protein
MRSPLVTEGSLIIMNTINPEDDVNLFSIKEEVTLHAKWCKDPLARSELFGP